MPELIALTDMGAYIMIGDAKFHIKIDGDRLSVRCSDGGGAVSGDRIFTHMPSGNQVLIELN